MENTRPRLTLDRPTAYEIRVPGHLDEGWSQWNESMIFSVEGDEDGVVTTLTGTLDQAALQGLLRRLYSMGLPLISVICVEHTDIDSAEKLKPIAHLRRVSGIKKT